MESRTQRTTAATPSTSQHSQRTIQWKDLTICASLLAASVWFQPALADAGSSCHFYGSKPAGENVVVNCAGLRRDSLSRPASSTPWQAIKHDKAEVVDGRKGKEWKVTFKGAAAKDKSRETLNMFFASNGSFIAANFTGQ